MNNQSIATFGRVILPLALTAAGCSQGETTQAASRASDTVAASGALAVEEALADADTGKDPLATRAKLEGALRDSALTKKVRGQILVALAGLVGPSDKDRAAELLEEASVLEDPNAEARLFVLLTGREAPTGRDNFEVPVAESAKALARFFPPALPETKVQVEIAIFGIHDSRATDKLGTFAVSDALRENAVEACGICDHVKTSIHTGVSRQNSWAALPGSASRLEKAIVVLYVTSDSIPPERYAKWLAAPIGDISSALGRGEGLVAVRERVGAPPIVTVAAPRTSRLATVEAAFAALRELPKAPVMVKLPHGLTSEEVRGGVRERFGVFKGCYEALLKRRPAVSGRVELAYGISGNGKIVAPSVSIDRTLEEPDFRGCVDKGIASLRYPTWSNDPSATTSVKYPINFAP